jgi:hypothetical protein
VPVPSSMPRVVPHPVILVAAIIITRIVFIRQWLS